MMRFFWTTFLPLSAAGGAAALLLWLARPALRRFAKIQWNVPVLTAALCLFVLPLPAFALPGAWNAPAQAVQSSVGAVLPPRRLHRNRCPLRRNCPRRRTSCFALRRRNIYPCCGGWSRRFGWQEYCV